MNHPISELMDTTMSKIRDMIDVNTIIGTPISTSDGITIIPVSKVSFGFGTGGADFELKKQAPNDNSSFGGGSGAGVNIVPVAFLIINGDAVRLIPVAAQANTTVERIVDMVPEVMDKITEYISKNKKDSF